MQSSSLLKPFLSLLFIMCFGILNAQQPTRLSGKIINAKNEAIAGATVEVVGAGKSQAANVEGRFSITLEPGKKYTLIVSNVGYDTKMLEDVEVKAGTDNDIQIVLEVSNATLSEVVVKTSVKKESTSALINFQRNNTAVSSGVAADFIKKTPDRNTGEVLKRVSGASIQDNKYVVVRGLGDRYNAAIINGAQMPSSEPDRKTFSFDIIPSSVIDNIVINKTATPDLPGEFAGGLVQVTTKDVPTRNFLNVGVSFGYNTNSTFRDFVSNERGKFDWIGFDDGRRDLPKGFPTTAQEYRALGNEVGGTQKQLDLTRSFRNDVYRQDNSRTAPIQTYQIAYGAGKRLKNDAQLGAVFSLIYRNAKMLYDVERAQYEQAGNAIFNYVDEQNRYSTTVGAMANIAYVKGRHKFAFKNLYNRFFEDNYYTRSGVNNNRLQDIRLWSSFLNQRSLYSTQLEGEHQLTTSGIKFKWNANYALNMKQQPDLRTSLYVNPIGGADRFEVDPDDTRRFFSQLQDHSAGAGGFFTVPFNLMGEKQTFKAGGSVLLRFRDFKSRIFRYVPFSGSNFNTELNFLPYDQIFDSKNISESGFVLDEFTNNEDKYFGISALDAGYAMFDTKFSDRVRLVWGLRVEFFEQFLRTKDRSAEQVVINNEQWDVLPSANLTFSINRDNNIRASISKTVSRPEFREIAPFQFYDYESNYGVSGAPSLESADIYNADLRYEWYPAPGEALTLGGFYKRFVKPIEFRLDPGSNADRRLYFYQNAKDADTYGVEFELRKNFSFLNPNSDFFQNLAFFGNLTYIFSQVRFSDQVLGKDVSADRPIQGQSPYLINGGFQYSAEKSGLSASLLYNRVGQRLSLVGNNALGFPDIYENPRDLIDFQLAKKVANKRGEIKLTISDILNQKIMLYENVDTDKIYKKGTDRVFSSFTPGSTITLGFTYDFSL